MELLEWVPYLSSMVFGLFLALKGKDGIKRQMIKRGMGLDIALDGPQQIADGKYHGMTISVSSTDITLHFNTDNEHSVTSQVTIKGGIEAWPDQYDNLSSKVYKRWLLLVDKEVKEKLSEFKGFVAGDSIVFLGSPSRPFYKKVLDLCQQYFQRDPAEVAKSYVFGDDPAQAVLGLQFFVMYPHYEGDVMNSRFQYWMEYNDPGCRLFASLLLDDYDDVVWSSLSEGGWIAQFALKLLLKHHSDSVFKHVFTSSDDPELCRKAFEYLDQKLRTGKKGRSEIADWVISLTKRHQDPSLLQDAAEALGRCKQIKAQPILLQWLEHEDHKLRCEAAKALIYCSDFSAIETIMTLLEKEKDEELRLLLIEARSTIQLKRGKNREHGWLSVGESDAGALSYADDKPKD